MGELQKKLFRIQSDMHCLSDNNQPRERIFEVKEQRSRINSSFTIHIDNPQPQKINQTMLAQQSKTKNLKNAYLNEMGQAYVNQNKPTHQRSQKTANLNVTDTSQLITDQSYQNEDSNSNRPPKPLQNNQIYKLNQQSSISNQMKLMAIVNFFECMQNIQRKIFQKGIHEFRMKAFIDTESIENFDYEIIKIQSIVINAKQGKQLPNAKYIFNNLTKIGVKFQLQKIRYLFQKWKSDNIKIKYRISMQKNFKFLITNYLQIHRKNTIKQIVKTLKRGQQGKRNKSSSFQNNLMTNENQNKLFKPIIRQIFN